MTALLNALLKQMSVEERTIALALKASVEKAIRERNEAIVERDKALARAFNAERERDEVNAAYDRLKGQSLQ